jgi:DNA-binding NarL/FixJ family response regulator
MYEDDDTLFAAVGAGAAGYLLKGADGADIVAAVRSTAAGHAVFGAALGQRNNVSNILNELHLVNRSEAIVRARESGLGTGRADRGTAGA